MVGQKQIRMKNFLYIWNFKKHFLLCLIITVLVKAVSIAFTPGTIQSSTSSGSDGIFNTVSVVIRFPGIPGYIIIFIFLITLTMYQPVKMIFGRISKRSSIKK